MKSAKQNIKITPMLRQYLEIKEQYPDCILFYRLGDFYEMFFEDAVTASRVLGITLTSRNNKDDENRVPLCGVPHHAASGYLARLVKAGFRVAVCEQVEDPKEAKGVVRREVVRVVSPGVVTEDQVLDARVNCFIAGICKKGNWGLSLLDISTGEFLLAEFADEDSLIDELSRMAPAELLVSDEDDPSLAAVLARFESLCLTRKESSWFYQENAREVLLDHFQTVNLAGYGCEHLKTGVQAAGALLRYVQETQKTDLGHIERLVAIEQDGVLVMDEASRRNLELTRTIVGGEREGSLLSVLDKTVTPMGARLFQRNLLFPLRDCGEINRRLDTLAFLGGCAGELDGGLLTMDQDRRGSDSIRQAMRQALDGVYDLERLNSRVVLASANGRDLLALKQSLACLPGLRDLAASCPGLLRDDSAGLDLLTDIHDLLAESIRDDAPVGLREGKLIKPGINDELDRLVSILTHGRNHILELEAKERERTGFAKLKIGFNKVFGYYLEVGRSHSAKVPEDYIRKQTLVNAERFITPELKDFEQQVLGAEEKRLDLEYQLFVEIRQQVAAASSRVLQAAGFIARVDFFAGLAEVACSNNYVRPEVNEREVIAIREGRHPVIERSLPPGKFVPNDIHLDQSEQEVLIVTGPNMAGKSTVLRQTALITLMAQMGSFVPAASAKIGIVDRIFTRVGAMDDLRRGQSTFMVEMNETANILNNATDKSLVILDEIGRGTSTFDGLAIAWAVTEDLLAKNGKGVKTIFATHYHELTELSTLHDRVSNFNIAVREWDDSIIFLHKLLPGGANRSYGIEVAALAGVPKRVVDRAGELLHNIEQGEYGQNGQPRIAPRADGEKKEEGRLPFAGQEDDPLRKRLQELSLDSLTPLEAMTILYELRDKV